MPKFYVQCGTRSLIVDALDAHAAAMHLIDLAMQPHLWVYDDAGLTDFERKSHLMIEALLHLSPELQVSERGLDRPDAIAMTTPELVENWHATMMGLSRLFAAAGLAPRPLPQLAKVPEPVAEPIATSAAPARSERSERSERSGKLDPAQFDLPLRPIRKCK